MSNRPDQLQQSLALSKPNLDRADVLVIGNGIAGLTAALEARHLAPDKRIVMVTDQLHPTINTPSLKQFVVDKLSRDQLLAYPAGTERAERIHVVTARVEAIHAQSKYVSLSGGRGFGYDALLIATGSTPTKLAADMPGSGFDGVLTLHRLQDYQDVRRRIGEIGEAVVIGGGVHAIETIMSLLHWGIRVHWLIRAATLLGKVLDQPASEMVLNNIRRAGVVIHTQTEISGIVGRIGSVAGVITNRQEMIPCQLVLTCTGTQPAMALAKQCSVPILYKNGILVDDRLRTSVRDIYAAGDVAALKNPQTGTYETRALWYAAVAQGRVAGAMMVGHDERARQPFGVQWHATYVGALYMLTVGKPLSEGNTITTLTDNSQGNYRRLAIADDRLVGYLSLGTAQPDSLAIKRIIDEGISVRPIIKALLKGNFDAREYLAQQHRYTAQQILIDRPPAPIAIPLAASGQLAPAGAPQYPAALVAANPANIAAQYGPQVPAMAVGAPPYQQAWNQPQSPIGAPPYQQARNQLQPPAMPVEVKPAQIVYEEEISPFSGNLPAMARGGNADRERRPAASKQPAYEIFAEELSPFSGNLPSLARPGTRTDELKPYGDEAPASTNNAARQVPQAPAPRHNLWLYTDEEQPAIPVAKERRRY